MYVNGGTVHHGCLVPSKYGLFKLLRNLRIFNLFCVPLSLSQVQIRPVKDREMVARKPEQVLL